MERHDPKNQEQRRQEAEKALGNDRKRTPPVSDRPIEEPVDPAERPQGEPPR